MSMQQRGYICENGSTIGNLLRVSALITLDDVKILTLAGLEASQECTSLRLQLCHNLPSFRWALAYSHPWRQSESVSFESYLL